jgi:hypothetical protein
MSDASPPSLPRAEWWARPRIVLPIIGVLVVLVALLTPQATGGRTGDQRLSTHLTGALGARLLYETAGRLGWQVSQRDDRPGPGPATGRTIHAVLAPPIALSPEDAHAYLQAVRGGDALLLVLDERSPLADSLGVSHSTGGGVLDIAAPDTVGCPASSRLVPPLWLNGRPLLWSLRWSDRAATPRTLNATSLDELGAAGGEAPGAVAIGV